MFYRVVLSGRAQAPANGSAALGGGIAEVHDGTLILTGAFSGLESDFNAVVDGGAHLRQGDIDKNGDLLFPLITILDPDERGGTFEGDNNTFTLNANQAAALESGQLYISVPR